MCRFLAYIGEPIHPDALLYDQPASLVRQSLHAREAKTIVNGDGFGLGWYGDRQDPGLYRETMPAWSDDNLASLSKHICTGLLFAHVRAATSGAAERSNCHPFACDSSLFMHNGQIAGYATIRRPLEAMIDNQHYTDRKGATDSEAIFLAALSRGLKHQPIAAMNETLTEIMRLQREADISGPIRFCATYSDGESLYVWRWASDAHPPTLYIKHLENGIVISSEPYDECATGWTLIAPSTCLRIFRNGEIAVHKMTSLDALSDRSSAA